MRDNHFTQWTIGCCRTNGDRQTTPWLAIKGRTRNSDNLLELGVGVDNPLLWSKLGYRDREWNMIEKGAKALAFQRIRE